MASSGTDRIQRLLELGEADQGGAWPDYLQYGFTETDIPALLDLVADQAFDQLDSESIEIWAPLHAWRTLGQLGSNLAILPLLNHRITSYNVCYTKLLRCFHVTPTTG